MSGPATTFAEFLREERIVSDEHLLGAAVAQAARSLSTLELAREGKLLPDAALLDIVFAQARDGLDFAAACAKLGHGSDALTLALARASRAKQPSFTQLLIERGALSTEQLTAAFDKFRARADAVSASPAPSVTADAPTEAPREAPVTPIDSATAALVSAGVLAELRDAFADSHRSELLAASRAVSAYRTIDGWAELRPILAQALGKLHELKGVCCLLGQSKAEALVAGAEKLLSSVMDKGQALDPQLVSGAGEVLERSVTALWKMSAFFLTTATVPPAEVNEVDDARDQLDLMTDLIATVSPAA